MIIDNDMTLSNHDPAHEDEIISQDVASCSYLHIVHI